jgi:ATP-binding cassette subfamily C protein
VLAGFAAGLLALVVPLATTFLFSHVIPSDSRSELVQVICILLVAAVGTGAFWLARAFAILRIRGRFTSSLQFAVWDRVLHLPPSFFRDYTAGDLATRALGAIAIRNLLTAGSVEALLTGIFSVSSLALLFFYDVPLALVALGFLVAVTVATAVSLRVQLRHSRALQRARTTISGLSVQLFAGIPKLRVAGAEERAFEVWNTRFMTQREATLRMTRAANALASCMAAVPILGSMVLFATVMNGDSSRLAAPQFLGFSAAFAQFLVAVLATTLALSLATSVIPVIEDIRPILRATSEADTSKRDPGELSGAVHLDHVSFRYGPQGSIVLDDVSLVAEPGERVAIVGPSGSGKSTILRLLLGFDRPTSGYVLYDGVDLAQLDVYAVREQIGSVLQDAQLMPTDILTNISGQLQLSPPEAWQAASLAEIAEDIRRLPMGMHTMVSEAGTTFSRGQRQRLLIARAIASRPKILIFDEATSALDNRTQESVMANLARLRITLITIAHRLSTVINADRIYVVIDGKVVASGTYEELLAHSTVFADLVRRQIV